MVFSPESGRRWRFYTTGKPCALLDVEGYFERLVAFLDHSVEQRFVTAAHRAMLIVERDPNALLDRLAAERPPDSSKWMDRRRMDRRPS